MEEGGGGRWRGRWWASHCAVVLVEQVFFVDNEAPTLLRSFRLREQLFPSIDLGDEFIIALDSHSPRIDGVKGRKAAYLGRGQTAAVGVRQLRVRLLMYSCKFGISREHILIIVPVTTSSVGVRLHGPGVRWW